ncbi:sialate O-acetylesterase [Pedobacter sp. MR2016-24]|uniref:sialate O-acetylesterase n=1 Tax=Pedobacter sp. MR2016-24 TaxID=2994466 RepID=UPI0022472920|nr:sialate O-acetylesterase [Pedobacter sp. MR2016-24]MCX2484183.1 sialate O-acetylesterase [Pedobacter sp. MR2016-24]
MKSKLLCFFLMVTGFSVTAQIRFPRLISDGMILQRGDTIKIWGWAGAKEYIGLKFGHKSYSTQANTKGEWELKLPPHKAGGPYEMVFTGTNTVTVKDILFGDVWLCSGQSNMELPMSRVIDKYPGVIAAANNKNIRQFLVPDEYDFKTQCKDFSSGTWASASPESVLDFSAVAYFFALDIYQKQQVPIGIINAALGGSPAQSWMSENAIRSFDDLYKETQRFKNDDLIRQIEAADQEASENWRKTVNSNDEGLKNNWRATKADHTWLSMNVPGYWSNESLGKLNGVVWFKKEIDVPSAMVGQPAKLLLGRIVDADSVFINGYFVGSTSYQYPPRRYLFKEGILKKGKNELTVRVINSGGNGGFVTDKNYELIAGKDTLNLAGKWKYKPGTKMEPAPSQTFIRWKPVGLYNAMIAPLQHYQIKGVLWYQGEANTYNPEEYGQLMQGLIADWRNTWKKSKLPFLLVQLPEYMEARDTPSESKWAELRAVQQALAKLPDVAMAVTLGLGEWNDIHPLDKANVGHRLALQAERLVYDHTRIVSSGPVFRSVTTDKGKLILSFDDTGSGLVAKDGQELNYFAIAGADKKYSWAKASINGKKVIVWNSTIANPKYVRYAWADNPEGANLFNREGLPASPFEAEIK